MTEYQYLIIGGGIAGGKACQGIREVDPEGSVGLITAEDHPPYQRPPLSKGYLTAQVDLDKVYLKPEKEYREMGVELHLGKTAVRIEPGEKSVILDDGEEIGYQKLLLATGARANRLPLWGNELEKVFTLRNIEDARQIREAAGVNKRALVLGGSFIGSEAAASLTQIGTQVVMAFPENQLLEHVVPPELGRRLEASFAGKKVRILPGTVAETLEGEREVRWAVLDNLERLDVDLVVMGVGVRLNTDLARQAGIDLLQDGSVVVDQHLQTNQPDIYAAGDITSWPDPGSDRMLHMEHWDVARRQGLTVGRNLAGEEEIYQAVPYFFSDLFDFSFEVWGELSGWEDTALRGSLDEGSFAYYYYRDQRLSGILAVDRPEEEREFMEKLAAARPAQRELEGKIEDEGFELKDLMD